MKIWVFISLNVQCWSFIYNVVYCNILRSIKAAFLELEKAIFTGATLVPMFTIITPGPYTHSKQPKTFHAKCNLKVNCENKMSLISKSDCMSVTDLNHAVGQLPQVVDVCYKLQKFFLWLMFFHRVWSISCLWLKNYKNVILSYSMTIKQ